MTEKLLQFIWQNRYYNLKDLTLTSGESLFIEYPGELNTQQGPDFINAKIRIGENFWFGNVELHLFSSGWLKHQHDRDSNYKNVILHVYWCEDRVLSNIQIPQLELFDRIPRLMIEKYTQWMKKAVFIPCENTILKIPAWNWEQWGARLLIKRLERKMNIILVSLKANQFHWDEQLWWMTAAHFGGSVNSSVFEAVAKSIPFSIIAKHRQNPEQLEALLMGQSNMLDGRFDDSYPRMLNKEYQFLKSKYGLKNILEKVNLLRMRPDSFPGIRFSQLANFYSENILCFSWLLQCKSIREVQERFLIRTNGYWCSHYVFDKVSTFREKHIGRSTADNIIINSFVPLLYTYGRFIPDSLTLKKSIDWLNILPAEKNTCITSWNKLGIDIKQGASSQALIELKKQYCNKRKCLECDFGLYLLKSDESILKRTVN